jgi:bifunctional non-homologous end joining protein LigD
MSQVLTTLDGVQIKLSNLEKVLWPEDSITKAELIQYYLSIYDYMKPLIHQRPLTLIRFPEGIHGNKFYSKNAPEFTPDWVPQAIFSDISYIHILKSADLIYLANLASLELHAMTFQIPNGNPDQMIFDLDPGEGFDFISLKEICDQLYQYIQSLGYHPHIKTSGSKGLHIYIPILPIYTREEVFETTKIIGQGFVDINKNTTLKISKENRQGKILIDIYRNHQSQTCIAPLSTRAKSGAPVSMPILYEHLSTLTSSSFYTIRNAKSYLDEYKPWSNFYELQSKIHNKTKGIPIIDTSAKLEVYESKRDFTKTSEPIGDATFNHIPGNRYTIQMHDATNLHYDLRLEENGVLTSWAIPKSIPTKQGIKRLAIRTEDHPLKYLDYEGIIPKGEYGGGQMWIYDQGTYDLIKKEEKSYTIRLKNGSIQGDFALFNTREDQWIIELKSIDKELTTPGFMLAEQIPDTPSNDDFLFEIKWDGIRVFVTKEGPMVKIWSKSGREITGQFPEIEIKIKDIDAEVVCIDGEIVCLDKNGIPVFANVISRMHTKSKGLIDSAYKTNPATLYAFDLTHLDGKNCISLPIEKRKEWLKLIIPISDYLRISDVFDDGVALFNAVKGMGMEGIMAKRKGSSYTPNKRSKDMVKVKIRNLLDVQIIGYTKGNGDRSNVLGAIHVGVYADETLKYVGKVGTGFDENKLKELYEQLNSHPKIAKPFPDRIEEEYNSQWIENGPQCEVQYASITSNGTLREPVFFRLKETE